MKEPSASLGSSPVPAFLMKLWALLEDPSNGDVITWNWDGQNFCILDDQRFCKEILPKYFKHNNLSSFVRQLNMYGFRKVMSLESGLVRSERSPAMEFQHPFFKKGKAELLEHIKRKISSSSSVKSEDPHLSQDELQKVASTLRDLKDVQNNMDEKLENMRRENEALWKEVSSLRRKHSQQQKLLTKIFQFILSLMRGNLVMGQKRQRQLTLEPTSSSPPKYSRNVLQFPEGAEEEVCVSSQHSGNSADSALQIHEIFSPEEGRSESITEALEQTQNFTVQPEPLIAADVKEDAVPEGILDDSVLQSLAEHSLIPGISAGGEGLTQDVMQPSSAEDADSVINSILNENAAAGSSDWLYREEIQDFLSCIDASLEELQTMLSKKKLNVDTDLIGELFKPDLSSSDNPVTETSAAHELQESEEGAALQISREELSKDKQLMQYKGNPRLSLLDLPSGDYGSVDLLMGEDEEYAGTLAMQNNPLPGCSKEPDLLGDDTSASQDPLTLFVLSPLNKLIDEAKEADAL